MTTPTEQPEAQACQAPLVELLEGIPKDARLIYEHSPTESQSIPVGRLAKESAAELRRLHAAREADMEAMRMALETLKEAKFVLDFATAAMLVPADADGPVVQIPAAIKALEQRVGES